MRIALLGTRGVPARYGGFETAVEEVGARLAEFGHEVTVYCRNPGQRETAFRGMRVVNLPAMHFKFGETLSHTFLSALHHLARPSDVAIVFNAANAPLIPLIRARRVPVAVHVDGLEWQRGKWGPVGRRYYQLAERAAVRSADDLITDSRGIADYYRDRYGADSTYIAYGAPIIERRDPAVIEPLGLVPGEYHLVVARFEPENHVDLILEGYGRSRAGYPLLVVGGAPYRGLYLDRIDALADADPRVRLLGGVWDQALLDQLYANAATYLHGHSVGGTNPSLLRAMGSGAPVASYDVNFNREVLGECGRYWIGAADLAALLEDAEQLPDAAAERGRKGRERARRLFDWDEVAAAYEVLCLRLAGEGRRSRPHRHRDSPLGRKTP